MLEQKKAQKRIKLQQVDEVNVDIDSEPTANNMNETASQMKTTEVVED